MTTANRFPFRPEWYTPLGDPEAKRQAEALAQTPFGTQIMNSLNPLASLPPTLSPPPLRASRW